MTITGKDDCPYGASDCPKVSELKDIIKRNSEEIYDLRKDIVALNTTVRNAGIVFGVVIAVLCAFIGVMSL